MISELAIEVVEHLQKAHQFLQAATLCAEQKLWDASTSRSYYSLYHTAIAVILYRHQGRVRQADWSHDFVHAEFSKLVTKKSEYGRKMADLRELRHLADYAASGIPKRKAERSVEAAEEIYNWALTYIKDDQVAVLLEVRL